jgi:hypothetical protein
VFTRARIEIFEIVVVAVSGPFAAPRPDAAILGRLHRVMENAWSDPSGTAAAVEPGHYVPPVEPDDEGAVSQNVEGVRIVRAVGGTIRVERCVVHEPGVQALAVCIIEPGGIGPGVLVPAQEHVVTARSQLGSINGERHPRGIGRSDVPPIFRNELAVFEI